MKYLVLLVILVVVIGVWRHRRAGETSAQRPPPPPRIPQDMLACAHCGVHFPQAEALVRDGRAYCCAQHERLGPG